MKSPITIKKLTLIQQQQNGVKKSCNSISSTLSEMADMLKSFEIHENHPLTKETQQATKDYWVLARTIGKMQRIIKQIETELITVEDN